MAGGLVEQHAAEAVADDDGHRPGRRGPRVEHRERAAGGLVRDRARGRPSNSSNPAWPASDSMPDSTRSLAARDDLRAEPHPRAVVGGQQAVGVGDLDLAPSLVVDGGDLRHLVAGRPRALVALAQQLCLARSRHRLRAESRSPGGAGAAAARSGCGVVRSDPHRRRDLIGEALQVALGEPVDVGEVGRLAGDHADRGAGLLPALGALQTAVVERQRERRAALDVQVGEVAAAPQRTLEQALGEVGRKQRRASGIGGLLPSRPASPAPARAAAPLRRVLLEHAGLAVVDAHTYARPPHVAATAHRSGDLLRVAAQQAALAGPAHASAPGGLAPLPRPPLRDRCRAAPRACRRRSVPGSPCDWSCTPSRARPPQPRSSAPRPANTSTSTASPPSGASSPTSCTMRRPV